MRLRSAGSPCRGVQPIQLEYILLLHICQVDGYALCGFSRPLNWLLLSARQRPERSGLFLFYSQVQNPFVFVLVLAWLLTLLVYNVSLRILAHPTDVALWGAHIFCVWPIFGTESGILRRSKECQYYYLYRPGKAGQRAGPQSWPGD